nr:uncharacterized protein LOC112709602 [Arachis hypogaea]
MTIHRHAANNGTPRNNILMHNYVENLEPHFHVTTLNIHVEQCIPNVTINRSLSFSSVKTSPTTSAVVARASDNATLHPANLNSDGDHLLDFQDFIKFMTINKDDDLRKAFEMFVWEKENTEASSSSSAITLKGLQRMLQQRSLESSYDDCIAMIVVFDINPN